MLTWTAAGPGQTAAREASRNLPRESFWTSDPSDLSDVVRVPSAEAFQSSSSSPSSAPASQMPSAADGRARAWLAFALAAAEADPAPLAPVGRQFAAAASALAAARPYAVALADVAVMHLFAELPPVGDEARLLQALNGTLVGPPPRLSEAPPPVLQGPPKASTARGTCSWANARRPFCLCAGSQVGLAATATAGRDGAPPECLGLGLVRAVDPAAKVLYVLTDVGAEELERVGALWVGRLQLPAALLQNGEYHSPYLCRHAISAEGSGAAQIKARNNLLRGRDRV